jgi:hypothetical protein
MIQSMADNSTSHIAEEDASGAILPVDKAAQ